MYLKTIVTNILAAVHLIYFIAGCSADTYKYDSDIRNKYWKLTELEGDTVVAVEGQREAHVIFTLNNNNVKGSGGCNNFSGKYEIIDDSIHVGALAATRMYCDSVMDREEKFLEVLQDGGRFKISDENLYLYSKNNIIARFKAIYF